VPVGTKGSIKSLPPNFIKEIGIQLAFVNTYHLVTHPGVEVIAKAGGIHKYAKLDIPLMSDSGGFQVFSLATQHKGEEVPYVVKISDDGVKFRSVFDGEMLELTPEKSIEYQMKIGADMMMAFDECVPYGSNYDYSKKAMDRTHEWLKRCIVKVRRWKIGMEAGQENRIKKLEKPPTSKHPLPNSFLNLPSNSQFLYGIIQGGIYEDLRKKSAQFVASCDVDGVAIGGVAVGEGKKEMRDEVKWVAPYLPKDKPVHLLGVGEIDDIFDLVKYGVDTFDCVEPTRKARMGGIFQSQKHNSKVKSLISEIDIHRGIYRNDLSPVDENCECWVCQNFTKSYLHHLFKQRELLGYTLATYHNLWVMERFFDRIREMIKNNII